MRIAFDADVLIYAAAGGHPLGTRVAALFADPVVGRVGSVLLLTEVLAKPMRDDPASVEVASLLGLLSRMVLHPLDEPTGRMALTLGVAYRLRAADAAHLATAVVAGADRFVTNNRRDFPKTISEVAIVYPDEIEVPRPASESILDVGGGA